LQPGDGAFNPTLVNRSMLAIGLEPDGERRWLRRGEDGQDVFSVRLTDGHLVLLELDVPTAPPQAQPLQAMFSTASELAVLLNARVVDDHGRPIAPGSIEAIEPALGALYEKMRAADLEPGSARARRLFA
jgi:Mg-chelatase subunit ChlD